MNENMPVPTDKGQKTLVARFWPLKVFQKENGEEASGLIEGAENPNHIVRLGCLMIFIFFGVFGVASFFVKITGAVVAQGRVKLESEHRVVQHLEGGIVDRVLVKDGEAVKEGQPLILLQSVSADANTNILNIQALNLEVQRLRLLAEKEQKKELLWPEDIQKLARELDALETLANEEKVFETRRDNLKIEVDLLKTQLAQLDAQIRGYRDQQNAEDRIIRALREELAAKRRMLTQHYIDKPQVLALEKELASHEGQRGRLRQLIAETGERVSQINLQIVNTMGKFVEDVTNNLAETEKELNKVREQIRPAEDTKKRLEIVAPVSGVIVNLQIHSHGGVINGGETLMDIVPEDHPLIIECRIPVNDITDVYIDQDADVQLDAFDYRTTPRIPGKVTYLSADRLEENGMPYYQSFVELDKKALADADLYISPGMSATVFIKTKARTVFFYMFEPLFLQWDRALRD